MEFEIKRRGVQQAEAKRRRVLPVLLWVSLCVVVLGGLGVYRAVSVNTAVQATPRTAAVVASQLGSLQWPSYGQAAIASSTQGVVATHGTTQPQPTASTAKLITMLAVMQKKPFAASTSGPTITLGSADVELYNYYLANNGSNVAVVAGEQITQYQAMEAVLLASSNNMADSLAIWAFGSLESYRDYATDMLASFGLTDTTVGVDASGLSPTTTSTAHDLAVIGLKALENPVLAKIVAESHATIPVAGTIANTNTLLAHDDIIGIKTGETVEAGGVFVLGGVQREGDASQHIVVTVMGAELGRVARADSYTLFENAKQQFAYKTLITEHDTVGSYAPPWSSVQVPIIATKTIKEFIWNGSAVTTELSADTLYGARGGKVGLLSMRSGSLMRTVEVRLKTPIKKPTVWWRIVGRGW